MSGSIYILQEREFIKTGESIYKIGRTSKNNLTRFQQYPKNSELIMQIRSNDNCFHEREIISHFKVKYIQRQDIGTEYFEGDIETMIDDIFNIVRTKSSKELIKPIEEYKQELFEEPIQEIIKDLLEGPEPIPGKTEEYNINKDPIITDVISEIKELPKSKSSSSSITLNDIYGNDNSLNATTNNNNTTNITFTVNPVECESLDHIMLKDFKYIFNDKDNIINRLWLYVYMKNKQNINFYKDDINSRIVSFLSSKLDIQKTTDTHFIEILKSLLSNIGIQLFYKFKNDLPKDELITYMKNFLSFQNQLSDNKYSDSIIVNLMNIIYLS